MKDFEKDNNTNNNLKNITNVAFYRKKPFIFGTIGVVCVGLLATAIAVPLSLQFGTSDNGSMPKVHVVPLAQKITHINTLPLDEKITIWDNYVSTLGYNDSNKKSIYEYIKTNFDLFPSDLDATTTFAIRITPTTVQNGVSVSDTIFNYYLDSLINNDAKYYVTGANLEGINTSSSNSDFFGLSQKSTVSFSSETKEITEKLTIAQNWNNEPSSTIGLDITKMIIDFTANEIKLSLPYDDAFFKINPSTTISAPFVFSFTDASNSKGFNIKPKNKAIIFNETSNPGFSNWLDNYLLGKFDNI